MGNKYYKTVPIGLPVQLFQLKKFYGNLIVKSGIRGSVLSCTILLKPSMESETYKVLISYKLSDYSPRSWLIEPEIALHNGKRPEHVYDYDHLGHPSLCVYYPKDKEWTPQMLLATTYIPWIITWLNTYEYWQITGEWNYPAAPHGKKKEWNV